MEIFNRTGIAAAFAAAIFFTGAAFAQVPNPTRVIITGDSDCGISSDKVYTHAVNLGRDANTNPTINNVPFTKINGGWGGANWSAGAQGTGWDGNTPNIKEQYDIKREG